MASKLMAGHSQFKNIMVRKGKQDALRGKVFTKIIREIIAATKSGMPDPAANPRLRSAVAWAREENMPRDKIDAAIQRGAGNAEGDAFENVRYEGYGPGGIALIVEGLTDNRHRTAAEIRSIFTKCGGAMGEPGSVAFLFDHIGFIGYPRAAGGEDAVLEAAIEAGADHCESTEEGHAIRTTPGDFLAARDALEARLGPALSARLMWYPKNQAPVDPAHHEALVKLVETLDDNDDVQNVFTNA